MSENFSLSTQYEVGSITIDGKDVAGLFQMLSIYENLSSPVITGNIQLLDTDGNDFIYKNDIEGSEEIELNFTNAKGDELEFKGVLNGLRNKSSDMGKTLYTFDFTSPQVRKNEETFVVKRFKEAPKDIIEEMIEKLGGETDKIEGEGLPMNFLGSRKRPTDIIRYVITHGVTQEGNSEAPDSGKKQDEKSKGTTGFMCWQTLGGYRFNSVDNILKGEGGEDVGELTYKLQNKGDSLEEGMESIFEYDFKQIGDIQTKMRSGGFRNVNISFDMDKGIYKEFEYDGEKNMTDKQKEAVTKPTRYIFKPYVNEGYENNCNKAQANKYDQSRRYASQNAARQNTFADQFGQFTLPPRFDIKAGDHFQARIPKVQGEKEAGYNEKHSGRYVISQVGHHFFAEGKAYTKVKTVRSTIQQDEYSSEKS